MWPSRMWQFTILGAKCPMLSTRMWQLAASSCTQPRAALLLDPDLLGLDVLVLAVPGLTKAMQFELKYDMDDANGKLVRGSMAGTINKL